MPRRRLIFLLGGTVLLIGIIVVSVIIIRPPDAFLSYEDRYEFAKTNGDWEIHYRPNVKPVYVGCHCIANLKTIDGAKATWALEAKKVNSDIPTPTELFGLSAYIRDVPLCPKGGAYRIGRVDMKPQCSLAHLGHTL